MPESTRKLARERNEHEMKEVSDLMTFLSIECEITEIKRIGPYLLIGSDTFYFSDLTFD